MVRYSWTKTLETERPLHSFDLYEYTQEIARAYKMPCCLIHRKYPVHGDIHLEPFCFKEWGMHKEQITAEDCSLVVDYARKFDFDPSGLDSFYSTLIAARLQAKDEGLNNE